MKGSKLIAPLRAMISAALLMLLSATASQAQDLGIRPLRYGNTSSWYYDNRDDSRDARTNGVFPGNFAADPPSAWLGAAGFLAGNSDRSPVHYPSQVVFGPAPDESACSRLHQSHMGRRHGRRHRCYD